MKVNESAQLVYDRLHLNLEKLKLSGVQEVLDNVMDQAMAEQWPMVEVLDCLFDHEMSKREEASRATRLKLSGLPPRKTLDDFDFEAQPSISQDRIQQLATLRFVREASNLILLGPAGVGKTHIAVALGYLAIEAGMSVYFISDSNMLEKLSQAAKTGKLERRLAMVCKSNLLILDELGYLPLQRDHAHLFFQVVCRMYEKKSVIITTNKPFGEWGSVLGDNAVAAAILDRLLHYGIPINIKGESYRMRERNMTSNPLRSSFARMKLNE